MTLSLMSLWLPILASAVAVFFASFIVWMVLPHHKADIKKLPDENGMMGYLKPLNIPPGTYMWPMCATPEEMKSDEYKARYAAGPWGTLNVLGERPNFGRNLLLTFVFYVIVGLFIAYIARLAEPAGASFLSVFRVAGAAGVLAYCAGSIPGAIFFGKPCRFVVTEFIDGVAYGIITGLVFAWLWPAAAVAIP